MTTEYSPVFVSGVNDYEWVLYPPEAGTIQPGIDKAEVNWNENYKGSAELGIRAFYENTFTEWTYKSIEKVKSTRVIEQSVDTAICAGSSIVISVDAEGHELYYTWRKNEEFYSSGSDNLISFYSISEKNSGSYSAQITGMCGTANTESIFIEVYPLTEINYTSSDLDIAIGESEILEILAEGHELSYSWQKEGEEIVGEELNYLAIDAADATDIGLYKVLVMGTCGNVESDSIYIFVSEKSIEAADNVNVNLWPTLVEDKLYIAIDLSDFYDITIYDVRGNFILKIPDCQHKTSIPMNGLSSGLYILKLDRVIR